MRASPSRKVFGKYEVLEELDSQGSVSVFRGRDRIIQRDVLLKVFNVDAMSSAARQRFVREAKAAVNLTHPAIASIYDFGEQDDYAYLAMELLEGETLRELLDRKGHQTLESKLQFMIEVCKGLAFAHESGITHREIRPENIFVLASGRPKILDFAIAQATSREHKAPKQFRRPRGDAQRDIFGASLVFFELLTNTHPFPEMGTACEVELDNVPLISDIDPLMPPQLGKLISRGLSPNPTDGIQSAADFAEALTIAAADQIRLSAELAQEVIGLLKQIQEVRKKLEAGPLLKPGSLGEMDISVLERFTPEIRDSMASEMDYFSILELQKECVETLTRLERFVKDAVSSEKAAFSELDLSFRASTERPRSPSKDYSIADEKLAQIASVTSSGDVRGIFAIVSEVSRLKRKWFAEYSVNDIELDNLEAACHKAYETIVEISKRKIHAAIIRGDAADAQEHLLNIEQICSSEAGYSEVATHIREQIQDLAIHRGREEAKVPPKSKQLKVTLISNSGRACPSCQKDNPMEAVVCESCDALLPGTRRLTPVVKTQERTRRVVAQFQDGVVAKRLSYGRVSMFIGTAVAVLVVAALLLAPKSPKVAAAEVPVVDKAVVPKDVRLATSPNVENKMSPVPKREAAALPLKPKSTLPAPAPAPAPATVKGESIEAAEKLLSQGKIGLENAETRAQLNVVIADMNAIVNMTFAERPGQAIQAEARKIKDKAANSLALVN
jgi:serine/threonine protein kinase